MINDVIKLREATGAGVMECKRALQEAKGDFVKAEKIIHKRGEVKMEERKGRKTGAGMIQTYLHNGRIGVLLELRCETDFVAKSDVFKELAQSLAMQIAAMNPVNVDELLAQPYIKDESITVGDLVRRVAAQTGENTKIERFVRYEI